MYIMIYMYMFISVHVYIHTCICTNSTSRIVCCIYTSLKLTLHCHSTMIYRAPTCPPPPPCLIGHSIKRCLALPPAKWKEWHLKSEV